MNRLILWLSLILSAAAGHAHDAPAVDRPSAPSLTRWAVDAALGVRLWNVDDHSREAREYMEQARFGPAWALDVAAFPWRRVGAGVSYSGFLAKANDDDIAFDNGARGAARDEYEIHYVAPAVYLSGPFAAGRAELVGQAGAGLIFYRDESPRGQFPGVQEGVTWGLHAAASVDYKVLSWLGVGIGARFLHGSLGEIHYNATTVPVSPISLTRVDVAAGVRFYP